MSEIIIVNYNKEENQCAVKIKLPYLIAVTFFPILYKAGVIDEFELVKPIEVRIPNLIEDDFKSEYLQKLPYLPKQTIEKFQVKIKKLIEAYDEITPTLKNPNLISILLPMSSMAIFQYRFSISSVYNILEELGNSQYGSELKEALLLVIEKVNAFQTQSEN